MRALKKIRSAVLATSIAAASVAGGAWPSHAAGPTHTVERVDFTVAEHPFFSEVCGFPVSLHVWGSWNVVRWTDKDGRVTREIRNFRFRSTSTANGVTVNGIARGPEIWTYDEGGSSTGRIRGVVNRRIPGQGVVTLFAGYEIQLMKSPDADAVVVFSAGPREEAKLLCSAFT
jgi:hypothetical protein